MNSGEQEQSSDSHREIDDYSRESDYRGKGGFETRYPLRAWISISIEAIYLAALLVIFLAHFLYSIFPLNFGTDSGYGWFLVNIIGSSDGKRYQYLQIGFSGALGGSLFSAKWLIHTVAKGIWNEDRRLWRFFVPLTAGITSIIFASIFQSGIISLFSTESFKNFEVAFAFGALVGYFSDAVIGVMSNIAGILFGTVKDRDKK